MTKPSKEQIEEWWRKALADLDRGTVDLMAELAYAAGRKEALEEVRDLAEHMHAKNNSLREIVSDMGSVMVRMVAGIEHLAELARLWEPDHSSGADRAGWLRAQDAKDDALRLLADLPEQIKANATQPEYADAIRAAMEADK